MLAVTHPPTGQGSLDTRKRISHCSSCCAIGQSCKCLKQELSHKFGISLTKTWKTKYGSYSCEFLWTTVSQDLVALM